MVFGVFFKCVPLEGADLAQAASLERQLRELLIGHFKVGDQLFGRKKRIFHV